MPPKKAKKVPSKTERGEHRTIRSCASSFPDPIMSEHDNKMSTDTLQPGASPGIISLADSDISNFEEGVNIASSKNLTYPLKG